MMATEKIVYEPTTSKQTDNFRFISFVSSCEGICENNTSSVYNSTCNVNGEEASQIYNEIISQPATSVSQRNIPKKLGEKCQKKVATNYNPRLTIFHHAQEGNIDGINCSLSKGNDIDEQDMYGWTALMCSTFEGHTATVKYLIKCGANLDIKNKQGLTALDIAVQNKHSTLIKLLSNVIVESVSCKVDNVQKEQKYCSLCKCTYMESSVRHETSIAHLVSSGKSSISTFYHIPENNKGFQIMLKKGWDKSKGLGINGEGRKFPVKTILKSDRACIGSKKEMSKVTHFGPNDYSSVNQSKKPVVKIMRERTLRKREMAKLEKKNRQKEIEFRREFN